MTIGLDEIARRGKASAHPMAEKLRALGSGEITVTLEDAEKIYNLRGACRDAAAELDRLDARILELETAEAEMREGTAQEAATRAPKIRAWHHPFIEMSRVIRFPKSHSRRSDGAEPRDRPRRVVTISLSDVMLWVTIGSLWAVFAMAMVILW
jgi:hypothetical protein